MDNTNETIVDSNQISLADRDKKITTDQIRKSEMFLSGLVRNKGGLKEKSTEDDEREI